MDVIGIAIGNVCSLLAMVTDSISAAQKTAKRVLIFQSLSQLCYGVGALVLNGYSAAVQNLVSILRNLVAIKNINSKALEWTLTILGVVLGLYFNNLGLLGLLPVVANLQYTLAIFRFKDNERALKISFMIAIGMFAVFNTVIYNAVGAVGNAVVCVSTAISLIRSSKK